MSLPRRLVLQCPLCDAYLEADVCYFAVQISQDEEENDGVEVDLSAFAKHSCGEKA